MPGITVLHVDDYPNVRLTTGGLLQTVTEDELPGAQLNFLEAEKAEDALRMIRADTKGEIDLMIIDRELNKGMNGPEFLRYLGAIESTRKRVHVVVTGAIDHPDLLEPLKKGHADALFLKDDFKEGAAKAILKYAQLLQEKKNVRLASLPAGLRLIDHDVAAEKDLLNSMDPRARYIVMQFLETGRRALLDRLPLLPPKIKAELELALKK